ncbi:hypothetical protein FHS18_004029 [Paenibacillus phyllosphaerae]|uniref:Uncharacterized protein n=1 Tax=Paenibacillus phyllosphaerae TaxID=274593 RepID=A0A7W5B136_9BACL|nr:hypothetical protein [Paenibacillus phyllosphaerae]
MELAYTLILDTKYFIFCINDDKELVHGFEFDTKRELKEFIVNHGSHCPDCDSKLNIRDIRVAFVKKDTIVL